MDESCIEILSEEIFEAMLLHDSFIPSLTDLIFSRLFERISCFKISIDSSNLPDEIVFVISPTSSICSLISLSFSLSIASNLISRELIDSLSKFMPSFISSVLISSLLFSIFPSRKFIPLLITPIAFSIFKLWASIASLNLSEAELMFSFKIFDNRSKAEFKAAVESEILVSIWRIFSLTLFKSASTLISFSGVSYNLFVTECRCSFMELREFSISLLISFIDWIVFKSRPFIVS